LAVLAAGFMVLAAWASTAPFDKAAFDKAVAAGEPVIVQFHADWCPTCKAQAPIVAELMREPRMKDVKLFIANFDTEKDLKKALTVYSQSTFVVFKGGKEVGRQTGQTDKAVIESVFAKAL
jgi:thiol-disulfide isomerase/thioredoxin